MPRGRPVTYVSEEDRPYSMSVRIPRGLYDRVERYSRVHRQTISELVRDGLEWRITEGDPRSYTPSDQIYNYSNTEIESPGVLQEILSTLARQETQLQQLLKTEAATEQEGHGNTVLQKNAPSQATDISGQKLSILPTAENERQKTDNAQTKFAESPEKTPPMRQRITAMLQEHPEGLSATELKVYLHAEKSLSDTLQGMVRAGILKGRKSGKETKYFIE